MQLKETFESVKRASKTLALLSDVQRNEILLAVADAILNDKERILKANHEDLAKMDPSSPRRIMKTWRRWIHQVPFTIVFN